MRTASRVVVAVLILALVSAVFQWSAARSAAAEADRAMARLSMVREQITEAKSIFLQTPDWAKRTRTALGQGGLTTAVNDALASAGLPHATLVSLSPAAEIPIALGPDGSSGDTGFSATRRRAVLTLAPLTLPQVGKVLAAWREAHADWTVSAIDLNPEPSGRREAATQSPGSDLPLRAVITIEILHVERTATLSSTHSGVLR